MPHVVFGFIGTVAEPHWSEICCPEDDPPEKWKEIDHEFYYQFLGLRKDRISLINKLQKKGYGVWFVLNDDEQERWVKHAIEKFRLKNIGIAKSLMSVRNSSIFNGDDRIVYVDAKNERNDFSLDIRMQFIWAHPACDVEQELKEVGIV